MRVYLDTSAAIKLVAREQESDALVSYLADLSSDDRIFSSILLSTEVLRAASALGVELQKAVDVLSGVSLVAARRAVFALAGTLPGPHLRTLDALHVATAVRHDATVMVAYDHRLLSACSAVGLETMSPG